MILILIFAEVLGKEVTFESIQWNPNTAIGLYGLIVALLMNSKATVDASC
jgi:hypothetical protein